MSEKDGIRGLQAIGVDSGSLAVVLIVLSAFLVFSGTLGHELVWDDQPIIRYARMAVEDEGITALALVPFSTGLEGSGELSGYYRPVSLISMWINSPTGEPLPFAYHLGNILLHVINSLLVFQLLKLLFPPGSGPLLGSLLFAVHPVHSESVAFVSGRTDLLAALFILLVVIWWYRSYGSNDTPHRGQFMLGMFFFALACLSKEIAFVLPGGLLLWAMIEEFPGRGLPRTEIWKRSKGILGLFVVLGSLLFVRLVLLGIGTGPGWSRYAQLGDANLTSLLSDVGANVLQYIRLMVFPWPLSVFYPPVPPQLTWLTWISALVFISLCLTFSGRRHHRIGLISLMWTLIFLFPVSGVLGLGQSVIAERFCYLPSIGVVMLLGYSLALLRSRMKMKTLHTTLVVTVLVLFSAGAVVHSARWKDNLTLFTNAMNAGPVKVPTIYVSLGVAYKDHGDTHLALEAFEEAVRLDPSYLKAWLNLGVTRTEQGEPEKALAALDRAKILAPGNPAVWYNRGVALEALGRMEEALEAYTRTAELDPGESPAYYSKGMLLSQVGRYEESVAAYQEVVLIDGDHVGAHIGMGRSYENMGQIDKAVEMFMKAIEVRPDEIISYGDLGRVLLETDRVFEAIEVFKMAAAMDPHDPIAGKGLVVAWFKAGEGEKARAYVQSLKLVDAELYGRLSDLMGSLSAPDVK
jgi:tetratricopeptide (TPR) repeat protein